MIGRAAGARSSEEPGSRAQGRQGDDIKLAGETAAQGSFVLLPKLYPRPGARLAIDRRLLIAGADRRPSLIGSSGSQLGRSASSPVGTRRERAGPPTGGSGGGSGGSGSGRNGGGGGSWDQSEGQKWVEVQAGRAAHSFGVGPDGPSGQTHLHTDSRQTLPCERQCDSSADERPLLLLCHCWRRR